MTAAANMEIATRFNPSVGILFCRTTTHTTTTPAMFVSIPRSGFCFVEQPITSRFARIMLRFQSLGRDSVLSNSPPCPHFSTANSVSIPRSGFCFVERNIDRHSHRSYEVSIPRSGFCFVEPRAFVVDDQNNGGFNPSVGILFCRTPARDTGCRRH